MSAKKQQAELAAKAVAMCEDVFSKEVISDEEWTEIQTLCALAVELIKKSSPSVVRDAGRTVEIRFLERNKGG